jgi:3-dehydroquinate dehydratase type I
LQSKQHKKNNNTSKLCITVASSKISELSLKVRAARKYNPGFIEMRIDHLRESLEYKERREAISKLFDGREILTLRSRTQEGKFLGEESLRMELIQIFVEECKPKIVDVELPSLVCDKKLRSVLAKASDTTKVIASTHFLNRTPAPSVLERIAGNAPDFVFATKIACKARNLGDKREQEEQDMVPFVLLFGKVVE